MSARGGIRRTALEGVLWTASSQIARQILQVGLTAVLARCIAPSDFGLIGMTAVTLACIAPLNELGLGAALVQRKEITPGHPAAVFWFQVGAAAIAAGVLSLAAPAVASFFHRDDLVGLLRIMCWSLPLGAAAAAPQALLLRSLRFGSVAVIEALSLAGAGAVAVGLALAGWGVWALVAQAICGAAVTAALLLWTARFNPLARSSRPRPIHVRELAHFSAPLTGSQILNFASRNVDNILIGKFLGAEALGYYGMAYRVMMYPLQRVSGVVGRISFPAFSTMQDDVPRIRKAYLKTVQCISIVTFPMMAAVMVTAPELTRTVFGPAWGPAAPLIAVLSLAGMCGSVGTTVGAIFLARGRTDLMLRWEIIASLTYIAAFVTGLRWGVMGVAVCYTGAAVILWPISHRWANRLIDLRMSEFFRALAPPAAFAAALALALAALRFAWRPSNSAAQPLFLLACAAVAGAAYLAGAVLRRPAAVAELFGLFREAVSSARGARREDVS